MTAHVAWREAASCISGTSTCGGKFSAAAEWNASVTAVSDRGLEMSRLLDDRFVALGNAAHRVLDGVRDRLISEPRAALGVGRGFERQHPQPGVDDRGRELRRLLLRDVALDEAGEDPG